MNLKILVGIISFFLYFNVLANTDILKLTDLSELKKGLSDKSIFDNRNINYYVSLSKEELAKTLKEIDLHANRYDSAKTTKIFEVAASAFRRLSSWILLLDSRSDNPYFSKALLDLRTNNQVCVLRIGLEILNTELKKIDSSIDKGLVLSVLFSKDKPINSENNFDVSRWENQSNKGLKHFLLGTRSYQTKRTTKDLNSYYQFFYNVWLDRSNGKVNELDTLYSCPENLSKIDLFPWFDYSLVNDMQSEQIDAEVFKDNLINLVESTAQVTMPDFVPNGIVPNNSFAMRPMLGLEDISPQFKKSFFEVVNQVAFNTDGNMTNLTCKNLDSVARFGSMIGLELQYTEDKSKGILDFNTYKETLKTLTSLILMRDTADQETLISCVNAGHSLMQLWNYSMDIANLENLQLNGNIRATRKEMTVFFRDGIEDWKIGLVFKRLNVKTNSVKKPTETEYQNLENNNSFGELLKRTRTPQLHFPFF